MPERTNMFINAQAQDLEIAGVYKDLDANLLNLIKTNKIDPKPLMICGGSTSSSCAAKGHWTLDLRHRFKKIKFFPSQNDVLIEAGVNMESLIDQLEKHKRSFPIGISGTTGIGYILTGGISPLSRKYGLAIDQVKEVRGIWATGEKFILEKPISSSEKAHIIQWKALCGAAPFLAIITHLKLKTHPLKSLRVWETSLEPDQLAETILISEGMPPEASLYWMWGKTIKAFVVLELQGNHRDSQFEEIINQLPRSKDFKTSLIKNLTQLNQFNLPIPSNSVNQKQHSEVLGMLGPPLKEHSYQLIKSIENLMQNKPNESSYISSQQLGGATVVGENHLSSFIHRDSMWKPWITGSWEAGNEEQRRKSLDWIEQGWLELEKFFPGVHLAQIHPHLNWHKKEVNAAFKSWLPELQQLKSKYDPEGILLPL